MPEPTERFGVVRHEATRFLRMPIADWPALLAGTKTELRIAGRMLRLTNMPTPTPLVGIAFERFRRAEARAAMFYVEHVRTEMLGAIDEDSVRREGFETLAEFRRYWRNHRSKNNAFKPLLKVAVVRLRPWGPFDEEAMGQVLLNRLYGEYLP